MGQGLIQEATMVKAAHFLFMYISPSIAFQREIIQSLSHRCRAHWHNTRITELQLFFILNRRNALKEAVAPFIAPVKTDAHIEQLSFSSIEEVAQFIRRNCNSSYLQSVRSSGYNFMYRGECINLPSQIKNIPAFNMNVPFDLLDSDTYQSTEAASFFRRLDNRLTDQGSNVKPSNGHLATTCPKEAAKWGTAVSIWPIGEKNVEFSWLENGCVYWPLPGGAIEPKVVFGNDSGLDNALKRDACEIMFRADNGFLGIPVEFDDKLKYALE